jgi:uncharacterized protein
MLLTWLKRHPVAAFFSFAYILSWAVWLPWTGAGSHNGSLRNIGTFGPTVAALLLVVLLEGRAGLGRLLRPLLTWRVSPLWYAFALLGGPAVVLAAIGLHVAVGGAAPQFNDPRQWYLILLVFAVVLFTSVLGEEIGWRGYALPRLQQRFGPLVASLILGVVWGLWHLPLFWAVGDIHQSMPLTLFLLQGLALTLVMTWVYNRTRGSLLVAHLLHTASNTAVGIFPILPEQNGGSLQPLWIAVGLLCLLAVAIAGLGGLGSVRLAEREDRGLLRGVDGTQG